MNDMLKLDWQIGDIGKSTWKGMVAGVTSGPHALTSGYYPPDNQKIAYNSFQKAIEIGEGPYRMAIDYGTGQERIRTQWYSDNNLEKTKYYTANYEKELIQQKTGTTTREICYISSPCGVMAAYIKENGAGQMYYLHTDHLGSITAITNSAGTVVERRSFDAWGRPRNPDDWTFNNIPAMTILGRGYTFHEHLPQFGLINMNGRMYDPIVARFLSVDPYKPVDMGGSQAFNGYSYCLNNPLKYTDPSGEHPLLIAAIAGVLMGALTGGATADMQGANVWKGIGIGAASGLVGGFVGYGLSVAGTAMNISGILPGMVYGAAGGAIGGGLSGGISAALSGTDFWQGVRMGAISGAIAGGITGGIEGGITANKAGKGLWWGNKIGYNRSKWSLAWWDKPDVAWSPVGRVMSNVKDGCSYAFMESVSTSYGFPEQNQEFWLEQANDILNRPSDHIGGIAGKDLDRVIESVDGYCVEQIGTNFPNAPREAFDAIKNGQRIGLGTNGEEHLMPIKKIKIWPDNSFRVKVMDPAKGRAVKFYLIPYKVL